MNEMKVVGLGLVVLGVSVVLYYFTDIIPKQIENREMDIIISLGGSGYQTRVPIAHTEFNHPLDFIIRIQKSILSPL
jgi:hypothetical protein